MDGYDERERDVCVGLSCVGFMSEISGEVVPENIRSYVRMMWTCD